LYADMKETNKLIKFIVLTFILNILFA